MPDAILTLNAGSSSLKFGLYRVLDRLVLAARGQIDGIGTAPHLTVQAPNGTILADRALGDAATGHEALLGPLLDWIDGHVGDDSLVGCGHRVVHGGTESAPMRVTPEVLERLERLAPLAPLHQPHNLAAIRAVLAVRPALPQIACFDTAFHAGMDPLARRVALPDAVLGAEIRRYGFHGLSYEYIAHRLRAAAPALAAGRVVVAHLGNGASLCAMQNGRSLDTTMGFSTLDGLVMGTRPGALDPGILLYLMQDRGLGPAELEDLLYHRAGLLGVSGLSADMRVLLGSEAPSAREAVALFVFRVAREIAALTATLGGLDGIVFTGGIGEHSPEIRAAVAGRLAWLGARLDADANRKGEGPIADPASPLSLWVIPTDEEAMIARHTLDLLDGTEERAP